MMKSELVTEEKTLLEKLAEDVTCTTKEEILFVTGHFPVVFESEKATESLSRWGDFSLYSLELACQTAAKAREVNKRIKFAFFADDHTSARESRINRSQVKIKIGKFYKSKSGEHAELPAEYREIMNGYDFSEKDVLRHNHKKRDREDCLYFSELILRASLRPIENACAREYIEFLEDPQYFDNQQSYLISFIPDRCTSNICRFVMDRYATGISATHVFMQTDNYFFQTHGKREHI